MKKLVLSTAIVLAGVSTAQAQQCMDNFRSGGTLYSTWQVANGVTPAQALPRLEKALNNEGFVGVRINRAASTVRGYQETSGSGRPQTISVTALPEGKGTRLDLNFDVQLGQFAATGPAMQIFCRILQSVGR